MTLQGRNILIIGATSGIGQATATLAEAQGATLYQASRSASEPRSAQIDVAQAFQFPDGFLPEVLHGLVYCPGSINLKPITRLTPGEMVQE